MWGLSGVSEAIMNEFTVIGYFDDNGMKWVGHYKAETWMDACQKAITEIDMDLVIVEVIKGHHWGLTEASLVEHACDFPMSEAS